MSMVIKEYSIDFFKKVRYIKGMIQLFDNCIYINYDSKLKYKFLWLFFVI